MQTTKEAFQAMANNSWLPQNIFSFVINLMITIIAYGAFPLIFANTRNRAITGRKYERTCYGVNLIVMFLFIVIRGSVATAAPYLLWTFVFSRLGMSRLNERGIPAVEAAEVKESVPDVNAVPLECSSEAETSLTDRFCRKCGFELIEGSIFCSVCGTEVTKNWTSRNLSENCDPEKSDEGKQWSVHSHNKPVLKQPSRQGVPSPKSKTTLIVITSAILLVAGYLCFNYFSALSSINSQDYIQAKSYFDNIPGHKKVFPELYRFVTAGVLFEEGNYTEAADALNKSDEIPGPTSIIDSLKTTIYSIAQADYEANELVSAERLFSLLQDYKRSSDYLLLIDCKNDSHKVRLKYNELVDLLGFEDAGDVIMSERRSAIRFLFGRWEGHTYYFELKNSIGKTSAFNLPTKWLGYNGVVINSGFYVGEVKCFKFTPLDENTIAVYCYNDKSTHKLYRQTD